MIPQIKEINFPEYATLSTATASLVDMGDKTITAQVKIDGAIAPDFSYDWEIEFQGERYIQPLRKPQSSKSNESISSIIDLIFYHKGIYDLKRYFFVSTVELEAGTIMADNYIVPLRLNIAEFVTYLNNVLKYYYGDTYKVFLNPDYEYDETDRKDIDINYTKIWDVITKTYEWFGVRWEWETQSENGEYYSIKIGYPSVDVSHIFEYGFEGGLLKFERQVQNAEIANVIFGRGSSENIPYRYFKNKSEDNPTFPADPDWIPELENVYFANLRGKTFRDYVQGWKTNPNRNTLDGTLPIEQLNLIKWTENEAYRKGHEDATFNPIEYVKDDESIAKYGEIQKGLEHNEEIKPTIQGITIDGIGRVDEIVDVEPILMDESTENTGWESKVENIDYTEVASNIDIWNIDSYTITSYSNSFTIPQGHKGSFLKDYNISAIQRSKCNVSYYKYGIDMALIGGETKIIDHNLAFEIKKVEVVDETDTPLDDIVNIEGGTTVKAKYEIVVSGFLRRHSSVISDYPNYENTPIQVVTEAADLASINVSFSWQLDYTPVHGQILGNYEDGATRKSQTVTIAAKGKSKVELTTEQFTITEDNAPATSVEMPYRITSSLKGGEYDPQPNVVAIDVNTGETVSPINLPAGTYYLRNSIQIENLSNKAQTFKVELLPTYIYYSYDSASWKPTFDIWVKNIWQTIPNKLEEDYTYEHRIWDAILGNHLGDEAKIVFSSGRLSGHSDWEFLIADTPKRDTSKTIDGVPSEWRITLYKSDAEVEATDKWLPSIMTQASAGDHFYFVGIEMPHQYVLWAEERLDKYKREELGKVSDVDSTIVVQLDKVRLNQLQEGESKPLLNSVRVGNNIKVADSRFIQSPHETLHLQSVTYTWDANTIMLPNIEVVLSDEIATYSNPFEDINRKLGDAEDKIKDIRKTSLAQIDKAKKSIRNTSSKINALSTGNANITNQVNVLIGDDKWMSVREIAEDVLETGTTSFAKDLTGVPEATAEEFIFRPSAGDKSIRDESAVIRRIKGNTTVWEQRVHNANFSEGKDWWGYGNGTITIDSMDGSAKLTHNSDGNVSITQDTIRTIPSGHKTLFIVDYKRGITQSDTSLLYYKRANVGGYDSATITNIASDERRVDAFFLTTSDDTHLFLFYPCLNAPIGTVSTIYKAQLFDLTGLFGAGNEPTTIEAFREVYPDDYYPYCAPEIRNMRATAIETVGFNLYNGDYAELIGGKTYYIGGTDIGTLMFTPNGTTASEVIELGDDRMYIPISSGKLSSTGTDLCVHFQHSGIKDGECANYVEHMLELPAVLNYFPDGMNGIGKVYDEINSENAIQRIGNIDLGTLNWYYSTPNNSYPYGFFYADIEGRKAGNANMLCAQYNSNDSGFLHDKSFFGNTANSYVYLVDSAYSDASTLKSSLSGVLLYYELAGPIVIPIVEPIQLAYDVEDFGTEKAIAQEDSAPFRADIVYQFNAEGRIRDNGRNIDKLETQVNTLNSVTGTIVNRFDGAMVKADGLVDVDEHRYYLPSSNTIDKNYRIATEQYVSEIAEEMVNDMIITTINTPV